MTMRKCLRAGCNGRLPGKTVWHNRHVQLVIVETPKFLWVELRMMPTLSGDVCTEPLLRAQRFAKDRGFHAHHKGTEPASGDE
jgi:hypothetical protein